MNANRCKWQVIILSGILVALFATGELQAATLNTAKAQVSGYSATNVALSQFDQFALMAFSAHEHRKDRCEFTALQEEAALEIDRLYTKANDSLWQEMKEQAELFIDSYDARIMMIGGKPPSCEQYGTMILCGAMPILMLSSPAMVQKFSETNLNCM